MPIAQVVILLVCFGIVSGMLLYFSHRNKKSETLHAQQVGKLQHEIARHTTQVQFRSTSLDTYHFLLYNLNEALVVQPEIKI
jgi:hypothetical protein